MPDKKISALLDAGILDASTIFPVVKAGIAKRATFLSAVTDVAQYRYMADIRKFGAVAGTDCTLAIQRAIDSLDAGAVIIPPASNPYLLSSPIVLGAGHHLIGTAFIQSGTAGRGSELKATAGFTGDAMILTESWSVGDWWHWGLISDLYLDGANVAARGIGVHQMGECASIERVFVGRTTVAGIHGTGVHAPFDVRNCSTHGCVVGVKLSAHPGARAADGVAGVVRVLGLSGDGNTSLIEAAGPFRADLRGLKSEGNTNTVRITGDFTGGAAGMFTVQGFGDTGTDFIRIDTSARPSVQLAGCWTSSYTNLLNDTVRNRTIPATGTYDSVPCFSFWNGSMVVDSQFTLNREIGINVVRNSDSTVRRVLDNPTDGFTRLMAAESQGIALRQADNSDSLTATPSTVTLYSGGAETVKVNASGLRVTGNLGVGNSAAATTLGSVVKKIEIFNAAGVSLGFIPVYSSIT